MNQTDSHLKENELSQIPGSTDSLDRPEKQKKADQQTDSGQLLYAIEDTPPWYLCVFLGLQHTLLAESSLFGTPIVLAPFLCATGDTVGISELIGTIFFVSGLVTLLQTVIGSRLPIVQGGSAAFLASTIVILSQKQWTCEYTAAQKECDTVGISELIGTIFFVSGLVTLLQTVIGSRLPIVQGGSAAFLASTIVILSQKQWTCEYTAAQKEYGANVNYTALGLPELGSEGHKDIWMKRIREIQGAIMIAGAVEFLLGFSGVMGFTLRFIGPLTIAPTISMIGFSLFKVAARFGSKQWWIALLTVFLVVLFSQYMKNVRIPFPSVSKKGCSITYMRIFSLFPVLLAIAISWGLCAILTVTDVFPNDATKWGYGARTDVKIDVLNKALWFRFPYPGQWGMPTLSVASVFGLLAAVIASIVESIGDYYACARLSGAPPPPTHAVNRGLAVEGIGVLLAGAWGTSNGTTSFSQNIGAIGITKVGSRRVIQVAAIMFIISGCIGKFGAVVATIPEPIFGGLFIVGFGMVTAVGLSNLQHVNMNSQRNLFVVGVAMFSGLCIPTWMATEEGKQAVQTGNDTVNQIFSVLLSSHMLVGGVIGFVLDNTIPGTPKERGLLTWKVNASTDRLSKETYDIPFIQGALDRVPLFHYIPSCPSYLRGKKTSCDYVEDGVGTMSKDSGSFNNPEYSHEVSTVNTHL